MGRTAIFTQLHDPAWLQAQVDAGLTIREIADLVGCTHTPVSDALIRYNITHARTRTPRRLCPHCGEMFTAGTLDAHATTCHRNPQVWSATRALLDDGDGGIVDRDVYWARYHAGATGAMSVAKLKAQFGGWGNVAQEFGFLVGEAKVLRDIDREKAEAEERLMIERELDRGLPFCSVRRLPTGETAYMLR